MRRFATKISHIYSILLLSQIEVKKIAGSTIRERELLRSKFQYLERKTENTSSERTSQSRLLETNLFCSLVFSPTSLHHDTFVFIRCYHKKAAPPYLECLKNPVRNATN
jgi:hypothetical protein